MGTDGEIVSTVSKILLVKLVSQSHNF